MKKRTWLLLLALALLLMAGCSSEKTMDGTITEDLRGDTEVNAFLMGTGRQNHRRAAHWGNRHLPRPR